MNRSHSVPTNRLRDYMFLFSVAVIARLVVWTLIPMDWNSDSYHHWQISYLSLRIGFPRWRMWDLNGCELYWGLVPHLVQAALLFIFSTTTILPYRALNVLLGGVNACLVCLIGRDNFDRGVGLYSGLLLALYPVAAVFDVVAMQETLALAFALSSVYMFKARPGWSGVLLALACQSRIEYWLASIIFVLGVALVDRLSTETQPFLVGWLGLTSFFCLLFRHWTSNPVYPLYWSLYNVFGGWTERGRGLPFHSLMIRWAAEKLVAWSGKATGALLLGSFASLIVVLMLMIRRKWGRYHLPLFFLSVLVVFSPLFVTYFPKNIRGLLMMLRSSIPIVALGGVLLLHAVRGLRMRIFDDRLSWLPIESLLVIAALLSFGYFIPAYEQFQAHPRVAFAAADLAMDHYEGGTIICDHPTINYRLVNRWGVEVSDLLGNHYSPHYYGVTDPIEYVRWFERNNVSLWLYAGFDAEPVWAVVSANTPKLLVFKDELYGVRIFEVDRSVMERVLAD